MADPTPNAGEQPNRSPVAGLIIPLFLIVAAGMVFAVFYFLNPKTPPTEKSQLLEPRLEVKVLKDT